MLSFIFYIFASFLSGLISFLSPCTLPLLPAYFAYPGTSKNKLLLDTLLFALGIAVILTILGIFSGSIGSLVIIYKRQLMLVSGTLFIIFGLLTLSGKNFDFLKMQASQNNGLVSFLFGSAVGLTWSGCVGPVLGFVLILAANTSTALSGGILLFAYSFGLVLPLFIMAMTFNKIPRDSKLMKFFRGRLFEFNIFGRTLYLHSTVLISSLMFILFGIFLILESYFSFTRLLAPSLTELVFKIEDGLVDIFNLKL